jgi:hypothetical protein
MVWVLVLDPVPGAAGDIGRAEPFRHDALEAELASVAENNVARFGNMLVELQAKLGGPT